jgi:predicted XRE-type DNA-binding protein
LSIGLRRKQAFWRKIGREDNISDDKEQRMTTQIKSRLREHIYRLSLERGIPITQAQISEATGITQATISDWMNMRKPLTRIDVGVLIGLSHFVGCNPLELLAVEEAAEEDPTQKTHRSR